MSYIKGKNRNQITLFPEAIDDYITPDNPVRVIEAFVNSLDMKELGFKRNVPNCIGRPSYDPRDLLKLYLYGYLNRVRSSRRLEMEAARNLEVMWLLRKLKPDFKTIADFRKDNTEALKNVFKQFSQLCREWDLYGQEIIAVDGSKFRASNSKQNNFNKKKLKQRLKYIDEKISTYLQELDDNDQDEADIHVPSAEEIKQRIEELEKRKAKYEAMQKEMEEKKIDEISTTDPDARMMAVDGNALNVCYNVQTAVDHKNKLIVDYEVINVPSDQGQLGEMAKRAKEILDVDEIKALADKGYYSYTDLKKCEEEQIETYVAKQKQAGGGKDPKFYPDRFQYDPEQNIYLCPAGQSLYPGWIRKINGVQYQVYENYRVCKTCKFKDKCTSSKKGRTISRNLDQEFLDKVDKRTQENKELYTQRQMIVEHPFGTIKRIWGYSYFLTRGLVSVKAESALSFLAYNFRRAMNILGVEEMVKRLTPA